MAQVESQVMSEVEAEAECPGYGCGCHNHCGCCDCSCSSSSSDSDSTVDEPSCYDNRECPNFAGLMCYGVPSNINDYGSDVFNWYANIGNGRECLDVCALTHMSRCFLNDVSYTFVRDLMESMDKNGDCCVQYNGEFCASNPFMDLTWNAYAC